MFVKQIGCVLASATTPVAQSMKFSCAEWVPLNVLVGRALAAAAVFVAPAWVTPASAGGLTIADPGNVLISADYSQIELRVLAHLSGEQTLIDAFSRDEDIHDRTATKVFGGTPPQGRAAQRLLLRSVRRTQY